MNMPINQSLVYRLIQLTNSQPRLLVGAKACPNHPVPTMTNSSTHSTSITSFIAHVTNSKAMCYPQEQINTYCHQNQFPLDKLLNIYDGYYDKFRNTYLNFIQVVLLLCIALRKIQVKVKKQENTPIITQILSRALSFIQDLVTSKMVLVCLASKDNSNASIARKFMFLNNLLSSLVPRLLELQMDLQICCLIQNCNKKSKAKNLISINFLIQFMLISTVIDFLTAQSERKFKKFILQTLQQKKKLIANKLWNQEKAFDKRLDFKEFAYLRLDIQSPKINFLQITAQGKVIHSQSNYSLPSQKWIAEAYKESRTVYTLKQASQIKSALDLYQFLFKLQVFASSPNIQQLDQIIPNEQFLQFFSKFLMGQDLVGVQGKRSQRTSGKVINSILQIKNIFDRVDGNYKQIMHKQLSKIFWQSQPKQGQQPETQSQLQTISQ